MLTSESGLCSPLCSFYVCLGGVTAILSGNVVDRLLGRLNDYSVCVCMCVGVAALVQFISAVASG